MGPPVSGFVVDKGLIVLVKQVDVVAPDRNKDSDGTIGDADHAARESAHNPESPPPAGNPDDQVDAADITHDPESGADMAKVTESVRLSRDRRIRLVIFNRRIFSSYAVNGVPAWTWRPYYGDNPHDKHAHFEVNDLHHDETQPWQIGIDMSLPDTLPGGGSTIGAIETILKRTGYLANAVKFVENFDDLKEALGSISSALTEVASKFAQLQGELAAMRTRLDSLEQGPQPAYAGTATVTLHVDTTAQEIDRGGQ